MQDSSSSGARRWASWRPGALAREFGRWRRERAMVSALSALDDGALKDIGIYRCEIPSLAQQRWRGPEAG